MHFGPFVLAITLAGMSAGACSDRQATADAVRATGAAWEQAYNNRDVDRLIELYAENAVSMPPDAPAAAGRKAIRAELSNLLSEFDPEHEGRVEELIVEGNLAVERAAYTDRLTPIGGGRTVVEQGKHIVVYRRNDAGQWQVLWEIWNRNE